MADDKNLYLEEYYKNEYDANKNMSYACAFAAGVILIIWICYLTGLFVSTDSTFVLVNIIFPISIFILLSSLFWVRKEKYSRHPGYKYFVIISFLLVIAMTNVIVPKHALISWILPLLISNHYYNPKFGRIVFIIVIISMLICIYMGMFLGEFCPDYLTGEVIGNKNALIHTSFPGLEGNTYPDNPEGRYQFLSDLLAHGENRYLKVFLFYYLPRLALTGMLFFTSNALNRRTYKLFINEIRVNSEQQKISSDLEIAKDIQLSNLPKEIISGKDLEVIGELIAAKSVGGDFYDYKKLDDKHVAFVIGDVSGKGIPAAMFMMKTITCFKAYATIDKKPSDILKDINGTIFEGNTNSMFVTCFLGILNLDSGLLKFANAGHNSPLIGQNKNFRYLKCSSGFVLGALKEAYIKDEETKLEAGDILTLYTDGVTEARNDKGEFYGKERLLSLFNKKDYSSIIELRHSLKDDIAKFVNGAEQSDDLTYMTILFKGDEIDVDEEIFDAKKENTQTMLNAIKEFTIKHNLPIDFTRKILVVGDELISNIIKYGYKDNDKGRIFIRNLYNNDKKEYILTIIDNATPFNPFEVNNSPISGDLKDIKEGGLGILVVKSIMDDYFYEYINQKNIVVLKKRMK